jgi:hypothetical protein
VGRGGGGGSGGGEGESGGKVRARVRAMVVARAVARAVARVEARAVARVVAVAVAVARCIVFSLTTTGIRNNVICCATSVIGVAIFCHATLAIRGVVICRSTMAMQGHNNQPKEGHAAKMPATEAKQKATTSWRNERIRGQRNMNASVITETGTMTTAMMTAPTTMTMTELRRQRWQASKIPHVLG